MACGAWRDGRGRRVRGRWVRCSGAVDLGCNFFDTAWAYGDGHSEELLGKILRANSDKRLYTATKVPPKNRRWPARREYSLDDCYPPEYIEEYVDKSFRNLGGKAIDL